MTKKQRKDIYQDVTNTIIAALEAGTKPWSKSWRTKRASFAGIDANTPLRHNGTPYQGINVIILWATSYDNPYWLTYKQAQAYGGQVRGGESGTGICFFKRLKIKDKVTGEDKVIPLLRGYTVFNAEQIDGLPAKYYGKPIVAAPQAAAQRDDAAEAFITATGATIAHGGDRAYYRPSTDAIQLPNFDAFDSADAYYATSFHELAHWTGHAKRLDRDFKIGGGTKDYAKEELVAELAAAYTCATVGVNDTPRADHADYLAAWLDRLKGDKKFIFQAASKAQAAADYLSAASETKLEEAA